MATIISFANHKGGVGKTSCVLNYGAYLSRNGMKVLMINFDSQGSLQNYIHHNCTYTLSDVLKGEVSFKNAIGSTYIKNLHLMTSHKFLETELRVMKQKKSGFYRWLQLELIRVSNDYDYIFIDTAPSLSIGLVLALYASNYVIVPTEVTHEGIASVDRIIDTISRLQHDFRISHPRIIGVIPTKVMKICKKSNDEILDIMKLKYKVLNNVYWSNDFNKAMGVKQPLVDFNPTGGSLNEIAHTFKCIDKSILPIFIEEQKPKHPKGSPVYNSF